jgi:DnaJ-class molecular chaperone
MIPSTYSSHSLVVEALLEVCYKTKKLMQCHLIKNCLHSGSPCLYLCKGGSSRGRRQRRGDDVVHPLKVCLEDLYNGTSKKLSLSRNVLCSKCNG